MSDPNEKPRTLIDRLAETEARYNREMTAEERAEWYVRDMATCMEALKMWGGYCDSLKAQIEALKNAKPGSVEQLIRDGATPAEVLAAGIKSGQAKYGKGTGN